MTDEILQGFSITEFLQSQKSSRWNPETLRSYTNCLRDLLAFTRAHGQPSRELLDDWQSQLEKSYARTAVNVHLAAANNYFKWCGRYDLLRGHAKQRADGQEKKSPALTRAEYLRLLRKARALDQHRTYLLVKLFATTDLPLQCLEQLTAEVVQQGTATLQYRGGTVDFHCPETLQRELLEYMALNGIYRGPVFITRTGQPLERTNIFRALRELCQAAGVPEEKGNPRSLRNLYKATQQSIEDRLTVLKQQMYDQMLEMEQETIGWQTDPTTSRGRSA